MTVHWSPQCKADEIAGPPKQVRSTKRPRPATPSRATSAKGPRTFHLTRDGTADKFAEGVVFSDGTTVTRWLGDYASTTVHASPEAAAHVFEETQVVFDDGGTP